MSRSKGTFNFAANFEGLLKAPIDSRQLVGTYADLTSTASWSGSTGDWLYNGAIVAVGSDPTTLNNGVYWLCDSANYTNSASWVKVGSDMDIDFVTGATNGLTVTDGLVKLGGTLTGTTVFIDARPTPVGLQYGSNYSSTFTNRSLVDKEYVDGIASGLQPKQAVKVATTGDTVLSGLTSIDGVSLITGDRILVKNQISGVTNGVYSASTGSWGRTADFDGTPPTEVVTGSYMWVLTGNTNMNTAWVLDTPSPVIGLSALTFVLFSAVQDVLGIAPVVVTQSTGVHYISLNAPSVTTLNNALTGATSGLHVTNKMVKLGGGLATGSTFIELSALTKTNVIIGQDGTNWLGGRLEVCLDNRVVGSQVSGNSAFIGARYDAYNQSSAKFGSTTGITINSCIGGVPHTVKLGNNALVYGANYCADYVARSIPDVAYVTGNTISTANNGLTKAGRNVQLGGSLTGNTFINVIGTNSRCLSICDTNSNELFSVATGETYLGSTGYGYIQVEPTRVSAGAPNAEWGLNYGGVCSYFYQGQSAICLTDAKFTVRSGTDLAGAQYCTNYCSTFVDRSLVDKQYVDSKVVSATGTTVFTSDITVSIASGKTFGRYRNLDVIPASGKTANQVILMALAEPLTPTLALSSAGNSVSFGLAAKVVNLSFSYTINSIGATVTSAKLEYDRGFGYITLSTTTLTPSGYTHNINDSGNRFNTTAITYRYTVVDSLGGSGYTTHVVTPQAYAAPTISGTFVGSIQSYETQGSSSSAREIGNKNTGVAGTITSNRSLVNLTGYTIQRNVNGGGWITISPVTFAGVLSKTITLYNDTTAAGAATSILYRIVAYDEYTSTIGSTFTITLKYASYAGINPNGVLSSAQIVALGGQSISGSRVRTIYFYDKPSDYAYYAYDASLGLTTSAIMDGAGQQIGAWQLLIPDVTVTNYYSQTVSVHVYRSNVIGSIDNTFAFS